MSTLSQQLEFVRHIPVNQLIARVIARATAQLERRLRGQTVLRPAQCVLRHLPKLPDLALPSGRLERTSDGWAATFLNHTVSMRDSVDWFALQGEPNRQLWRMHLHYFDYLKEMRTQLAKLAIDDWIRRVRPFICNAAADSWTPYATSLRIVNWLRWRETQTDLEDPAFLDRFASSLCEQTRYLFGHLEHDVRGNHLMKNIVALIAAADAIDHPDAVKWRRAALTHLSRELKQQVLADGVHFERSPSYHTQVLGDLLQIRACLNAADSVPDLDAAITRMAKAAVALTHPDGYIALFNDAGLNMGASVSSCLSHCDPPAIAAVTGSGHIHLPQAGYFGYRDGGDYFLADMGPLGPDALMAHAHADCGSFEWSLSGERVIVDQGVFEYFAGPRRNAARSSQSHNVLSLDGIDQADFFGSFRCGRRPSVFDVTYTPATNGFILRGTHDGYTPLGPGALLTREIAFAPSRVIITDSFRNHVSASGRVGVLLHPKVAAQPDGTAIRLRGAANVVVTGNDALLLEDAVFWPDLGVSVPTKRIIMRVRPGTKRAEMTFVKVVS